MATTQPTGRGAAPAAPTATPGPMVPIFTEAPASVTVKVTFRGFDTMLTLRDVDGAGVLGRMERALAWLEDKGATPAPSGGHRGQARPHSAPAVATDGQDTPRCPTHGSPMRPGNKGGWFCPRRVADDDGTGKPAYCRQRVNGGAS